jgi:hypothetical protein
MAITKIAQVDVGVLGATSIDFTSIPGTYTDLQLVLSGRSGFSFGFLDLKFTFNGSSAGYSEIYLYGTGSSAASGSDTGMANGRVVGVIGDSTTTANTFSNVSMFISNYSSATNKTVSIDGVSEANASGARQTLVAQLWANAAAITSISLTPQLGTWVQYSSATLYGISKSGATGATVS